MQLQKASRSLPTFCSPLEVGLKECQNVLQELEYLNELSGWHIWIKRSQKDNSGPLFVGAVAVICVDDVFGKKLNSNPVDSTDLGSQSYTSISNRELYRLEQLLINSKFPFAGFTKMNMVNCTTRYGNEIQLNQVPLYVLEYMNEYCICASCGNVYWYNPHRISF